MGSALALAAVVAVIVTVIAGGGAAGPVIAGIPCERGERLDYHVHAHLAITVEGLPVEVPAEIGVKSSCIYWLHTHDARGIIHVEAPSQGRFTLGQFFSIWEQPLSATALLDRQTDAAHEIRAFVNGEPFPGDPADIPLDDRTSIVVQYGPPFPPPAPFQFPRSSPR